MSRERRARPCPSASRIVLVLRERDGALEDVQRQRARRRPRDRRGGRRRPSAERHAARRARASPARPRSSSSIARRTIVADVLVGQRLEAPDAQPRQERRVHLEVGVLGRRADQRDRAVLDVRQQRVLLGLVEAVDLVDEQDRAAAVEREPVLGLGDRGADLGDAGHDRRHGSEVGADGVGEQAGERRLAGAGRAPQQEAREVAAGDRRGAAGRARRRGCPGRRTPRASAGASGRRAAAARAAARNRASGRAPGTRRVRACGRWYDRGRGRQVILSTPVTSIAMYSANRTTQQQDRDPQDVLQVARDVGVFRRIVEGANRSTTARGRCVDALLRPATRASRPPAPRRPSAPRAPRRASAPRR